MAVVQYSPTEWRIHREGCRLLIVVRRCGSSLPTRYRYASVAQLAEQLTSLISLTGKTTESQVKDQC